MAAPWRDLIIPADRGQDAQYLKRLAQVSGRNARKP
jgi:hypothetical protein